MLIKSKPFQKIKTTDFDIKSINNIINNKIKSELHETYINVILLPVVDVSQTLGNIDLNSYVFINHKKLTHKIKDTIKCDIRIPYNKKLIVSSVDITQQIEDMAKFWITFNKSLNKLLNIFNCYEDRLLSYTTFYSNGIYVPRLNIKIHYTSFKYVIELYNYDENKFNELNNLLMVFMLQRDNIPSMLTSDNYIKSYDVLYNANNSNIHDLYHEIKNNHLAYRSLYINDLITLRSNDPYTSVLTIFGKEFNISKKSIIDAYDIVKNSEFDDLYNMLIQINEVTNFINSIYNEHIYKYVIDGKIIYSINSYNIKENNLIIKTFDNKTIIHNMTSAMVSFEYIGTVQSILKQKVINDI